MTASAPPTLPASLDLSPPAPLDPEIASANLAALRETQPDFADRLAAAQIPAHWRPVLSLDRHPAWRIENPGDPAQWLAGTAAPTTRAAGLLASVASDGNNIALSGIAAGAELAWLLNGMPPTTAVFVAETDLAALRAVLAMTDFSGAIRTGRVWFFSDLETLIGICRENPGLLPPARLILVPGSADRLDMLKDTCRTAATAIDGQRQAALAGLRIAPRDRTPRLAILAAAAQPAASLAAAARSIGVETNLNVLATPLDVHPLHWVKTLAAFGPSCLFHVKQPPLPASSTAKCVSWMTAPDDVAAGEFWLGASPAICDALRRRAAQTSPPPRVSEWFWAADEPPPAPSPEGPPALVILADLPAADQRSCGIQQPTHKLIWKQMLALGPRLAREPELLEADALLTRGQQAAGISITDPTVRAALREVTAARLIPALAARTIEEAACALGQRVVTIGAGWDRPAERCANAALTQVYSTIGDVPSALRVTACVVINAGDPLSPALLAAAIRGWPLLMQTSDRAGLRRGLGGVLGEEHYLTFQAAAELKTLLGDATSLARRGARAAEHVRQHHTWDHRLRTLLRLIDAEGGA